MEQFVSDETEYDAWVEDYEWVGIVYPQDVQPKVTLITPLAFYNQDKIWQTISNHIRKLDFPNNGKVVYFSKDVPEHKVNRLYRFWPERSLRSSLSENATTYSRYFTYSAPTQTSEPLAQVFDWTARAHDLFAIVELLQQGLLIKDCISHTIFINYQNKIYGPIHLEPDYHDSQLLTPREYNQKLSPGGQPLLVKGFPFSTDKMITMAGQIFLDLETLGSPTHQTDWSLPQTTIKRVLRASKKLSPELKKKVHLVDKEINDLAALSAASGSDTLRLEEGVIQRGQYIVRHQTKRLGELQTLFEELPAEHPLLEQARALEIQLRKDRIVQECEAEQSHLQALQVEVRSVQKQLTCLNGEIETATQKQEQMRADLVNLEATLPQRLTAMRTDMLSLLTELQLTSAPTLIDAQTQARGVASELRQSEGASAELFHRGEGDYPDYPPGFPLESDCRAEQRESETGENLCLGSSGRLDPYRE